MHVRHLLLALGTALAGCGGMMSGSDAVRGSIDDAVAEDDVHLSAARTITTMPPMMNEVDRHTSHMTMIMDDMHSHMASMPHCSGSASMMELRDGMRSELESHATEMHALVDLDVARAAVEAHTSTMDMMLGDMRSMLDRMHCGGW